MSIEKFALSIFTELSNSEEYKVDEPVPFSSGYKIHAESGDDAYDVIILGKPKEIKRNRREVKEEKRR